MKIKNLKKEELHLFQINVIDKEGDEVDGHFIGGSSLEVMKNYFGEKEVIYEEGDEEGDLFCRIEIDFNSFSSFIRKIKTGGFYMDYIEYSERAKKQQMQCIGLIDYLYNQFNKNGNTFYLFQYLEK